MKTPPCELSNLHEIVQERTSDTKTWTRESIYSLMWTQFKDQIKSTIVNSNDMSSKWTYKSYLIAQILMT